MTRESTIFTSNVSICSAGRPHKQPLLMSYRHSHLEHVTFVPSSEPAASEDPQRMHESSTANIFPSALNRATAVSAMTTAIAAPGAMLHSGAASTKSVFAGIRAAIQAPPLLAEGPTFNGRNPLPFVLHDRQLRNRRPPTSRQRLRSSRRDDRSELTFLDLLQGSLVAICHTYRLNRGKYE